MNMNYMEVEAVPIDAIYKFAVNKAGTDIVGLNRPQVMDLIELYIDLALQTKDEEWFINLTNYKKYVLENKLS
ncbi:IDEAL domain-containing protein [Priestia sp. SB1]|uniref:IDEAL domain-containing protein n=1 Tax=Priestia sp. SB1 TaxID=3132359 RepID=UPI0031709D44